MTPGCDGCEVIHHELVGVLQVLCGARERDRWDWVDLGIEQLKEILKREGKIGR